MGRIRAWLSREASGLYMLSHGRPVVAPVGNTGEVSLYVPPGDPIGLRHLCPWGVKVIWGVELEPLESVVVSIEGKDISSE